MALAHKFDIVKYLNPQEYCNLTRSLEKDGNITTHKSECHLSGIGIKEVLKKLDMQPIYANPNLITSSRKQIHEVIKSINNKNFNILRVSTLLHTFYIEINGKFIRILSLSSDRHGFYDYFNYSKFGKYFQIDGGTYNEMLGYFNDIIKFKPKDEGHLPRKGEVKPIFKNPKEGESKMYKAIDAWIKLFGVRHDGLQAEGPKTTMFDLFTKFKDEGMNPNDAAAKALKTLKSKDLNEYLSREAIYYNELSSNLIKYYTKNMPLEDGDLGYLKVDMDKLSYHQLSITSYSEYSLQKEIGAGEGYIKIRVHKLNY